MLSDKSVARLDEISRRADELPAEVRERLAGVCEDLANGFFAQQLEGELAGQPTGDGVQRSKVILFDAMEALRLK